MAGEKILLADDSRSIQEISKNVLEEAGYKVTVASNGIAALSHPELLEFDLIILDSEMDGLSGLDTTSILRTDPVTHQLPVLLLIPENQQKDRVSQSLRGAKGYISKPFKTTIFLLKVEEILEEQRLLAQSRKHLERAADEFMEKLAQEHIQDAVEKKTQIIVERTIQNVISLIDQQARKQVEEKVTSLTAEKEQQLVKSTVHEVAQSMVEKLAERKVTEASETILREETEKAVKRVSDTMLPGLVRERVKENIANIMPREVENEVKKAAESMFPKEAERFLQTVHDATKKVIPAIAKEQLAPLIERQLQITGNAYMPRIIREVAIKEVRGQLENQMRDEIQATTRKIRSRLMIINLFILVALLVAAVAFSFYVLQPL
jgi:CheY-like chemotaxis protein